MTASPRKETGDGPGWFLQSGVLRIVAARPRFFLCIVLGVSAALLTPPHWRLITRGLVGWDIAIAGYFVLISRAIIDYGHEDIRQRAQALDSGRYIVLLLTSTAAVIALGAVVAELGPVKNMTGFDQSAHLLLAGGTIILSWFFTHMIFALHYAHEYYLEWDAQALAEGGLAQCADVANAPDWRGGLSFPGNPTPTYLEFMYFSYVIGVASQTADISICSRPMRIVGLTHSILSFFFNTTILALTINLAAGLF